MTLLADASYRYYLTANDHRHAAPCAVVESLDDETARKLCQLLESIDSKPKRLCFAPVTRRRNVFDRAGKVRICVQATDGREMTLTELGRGDFFWRDGVLDGQRRSADAIVAEDARWLYFRASIFLSFVRSSPDVALELLTALANRLRHTDELLRRSATRNVNVEEAAQLTFADRASDLIAEFAAVGNSSSLRCSFSICGY